MIILNIAGTLTGFVAVSGIAITIVLAYLYVFIPIVAVLILAYFAIAAGLGWLLASFGP